MKLKNFLITTSLGINAVTFFALPIYANSAIEVGRMAKSVTVLINSPQSTGSGVLIQKSGNIYTVLTAAHVVRDQDKSKALTIITTQDGQKFAVTAINATKDIDLAVVKFESKTNLKLAKFGDSNKTLEGSVVYVSGFPLATQAISDTIYNFTEGKVTANAKRPLSLGYSLVYSNSTLPGMSGGPVFNTDGELIAIHGRGDFQENSRASDINENVRVKTGFNLGITVSTVQTVSTTLGLNLGQNKLPLLPPPAIASVEIPQADDYFLQGVDRFRRNDWAGAAEMMDKALKLNPKYLRAYTARGAANYMLNRVARGVEDMEAAIKIDPNYATGYVGKCFLLNELEQWGQALGNCDRAIALAPNLSIAYNVRGLVNTSLNNLAPAQNDLQKSIDLDPKSYYAYNNMATIYALRNNPQVALRYVRQAIQLNPQSAGSRVLFGQLLVLTGAYQQAISVLNRAIAINPRISNAYEYRGLAYLKLGNTNQARLDTQFAQGVARSSPQGFIEDLSFLNQ
jgi:tetratricopeptide (TPR) repeat protein/V8-like Glu-specific endopeptidase